MPDRPRKSESANALVDDLYAAGFYAVSHAVRKGIWTPDQALAHVRERTTAHRNETGRAMAQDVLDRWERR